MDLLDIPGYEILALCSVQFTIKIPNGITLKYKMRDVHIWLEQERLKQKIKLAVL